MSSALSVTVPGGGPSQQNPSATNTPNNTASGGSVGPNTTHSHNNNYANSSSNRSNTNTNNTNTNNNSYYGQGNNNNNKNFNKSRYPNAGKASSNSS